MLRHHLARLQIRTGLALDRFDECVETLPRRGYRFIGELERLLGRRAVKEYLPLQQGDVPATFASIERLAAATGFAPTTPLAEGLSRFVAWYREYYGGAEPASGA